MDLNSRFDVPKLLRFAMPTVIMMVFTSIYSMVDGIFVSRFVSADALTAVNIVYPMIFIVTGIGIMFSTGGSACVGKTMGEGNEEAARSQFSLICLVTAVTGAVLSLVSLIFMEELTGLLGATDRIAPMCVEYGAIMMAASPLSMLQIVFQMFFVTAGKPKTGLYLTVISGLSNVVLDYLFIAHFGMGIRGAALATAASFAVGALFPLWYFLRKRRELYFGRPKFDAGVIFQSMYNGASEMVSNAAAAVTTFLFNITMMRIAAEEGVAAVTIVLYTQFLFTSVYLGFSNGVAPIFSVSYGSQNRQRIKQLRKICFSLIVMFSVVSVCFALAVSRPLIAVFAKEGTSLFDMALRGFRIFAVNFLLAGVNIFASSYFTALSNGKASAIISFSRTFVFQAPFVVLLPYAMGIDGVWLAIPFAEAVTLFVVLWQFVRYKGVYCD